MSGINFRTATPGRGRSCIHRSLASKLVLTYMEDVRAKGMFILAANVAIILPLFLSISASIEPQVPS